MMLLLLIGAVTAWLVHKMWVSVYKHWELRGMPFLAGGFPWGTGRFFMRSSFQGEVLDQMYKKIPSPYFGIYVMRTPFIVVKDPEIIKLVMAKDFTHFSDRQPFKILKDDLLAHHLFNLDGERWKALREKMGPIFTNGKIEGMFQLFVGCSETLSSLMVSKAESESSIDVKDIVGRFTMDTILSCGFGIDLGRMLRAGYDLRDIARPIIGSDTMMRIKMLLWRVFPSMSDTIPFRLEAKETEEAIIKYINKLIEFKKKNGINRNDFLDLLIQLKEKDTLDRNTMENHDDSDHSSLEFTVELMAAQSYAFFVDGYETSSSVQTYCLYELALNQEIQQRLHQEIDRTISKHGGLTYEAVKEMEYLDMVVHETMRKYPTIPILSRSCTKPFSMPAGNRIREGDKLLIPVWSLHHDSKYFPKPEVFDPERFLPENKEKMYPYTYMPFGEGPRICIGMRFGLLQTKVCLITILRKFRVAPAEETMIPLKFRGSILVTLTEQPIYLKFHKRPAINGIHS